MISSMQRAKPGRVQSSGAPSLVASVAASRRSVGRALRIACSAAPQQRREQPDAPARRALLLAGAVAVPVALQTQPALAAAGTREIIDKAYRDFNTGDLDGFLSVLSPKATIEFGSWTPKAVYFGPEGFKEFSNYLFSKVEDSSVAVVDRFVNGNDAVYLLKVTVTKSRKTGNVKTFNIAHHWTLKGGKVTAFHEYSDSQALSRLLA